MKYCDWYFWEGMFSKDQIKDIYAIREKNFNKDWKDVGAVRADGTANLKHVSSVNAVEWQYLANNFEDLEREIKITNRLNYGYNIEENFPRDSVLFNEYDTNGSYDWHKDGSNHPNYDFKFTVIVNTSLGEYEGGDLQLFSTGGPTTVTHLGGFGSAVIFKSDTPHRVTPVTKGQRRSLVYWKKGPNFV